MKADSFPGSASNVVTSAAMVAPTNDKNFARRDYISRPDAPAVHARFWGNPQQNCYVLNFNGEDMITMQYPAAVKAGLRFHSDGDFQAFPFIQQFLMWAEQPAEVIITVTASVEMWNVRPERAGDGRAILGQMGAPLLYGVNGMYFPDWDLLISWHGHAFTWRQPRVARTPAGYSASMRVPLDRTPLVILIRPHYFSEHLGYSTHKPWQRRINPRAISGWCSWEAYHSDVTLANLQADAHALAGLRPYGLEIMQLDDGYQNPQVPPAPGHDIGESWLHPVADKFPGGHEAIVQAMRSGGFTPGIWTNATLTNKEAAQASGVCIVKADGTLLSGDWIQYVITCDEKMLAAQITPYYRALREKGYRYFKSDALRHLIYDGLQEAVRLGLMEPEEARRRHIAYLRAARRGIGEDAYYLSCWGVLTSAIGICDAMRVGTDANPTWGAYSMQLRETARWFFAQRVLFTLDPDHVCVRGKVEWVRMMLSLVSLSGGLLMISDRPETYDAVRMDMIRRTLPALTTHTAEVGPVDYTTPACAFSGRDLPEEQNSRVISGIVDAVCPFSSLWCTHFDHAGRIWAVVQRAAVIALQAARIPLASLALDPAETYYAYDFWQHRGHVIREEIDFPALTVGDTNVLSLTNVSDGRAHFVASDRHVSMDAVSVVQLQESDDEITMTLAGFAGLTVEYVFYTPAGEWTAHVDGGKAALCQSQELTRVSVRFFGEQAQLAITRTR